MVTTKPERRVTAPYNGKRRHEMAPLSVSPAVSRCLGFVVIMTHDAVSHDAVTRRYSRGYHRPNS